MNVYNENSSLLNLGGDPNDVISGADIAGAVVVEVRFPPVVRRPAADTNGSPVEELEVKELSRPVME